VKDKMQKKYQPLTMPKIQWEVERSTETFGEQVVQPLEPGFGITLGNALRRVLLSSIEGAAVVSIVIKGVNNEFATLKGLREDVLQLVLNIKGIVIKNTTGEPGTMKLKASGEQVVTAGQIETSENLSVLNKEHVLANLAQDGDLEIEFVVENGRGYKAAQWQHNVPIQPDGRIFVDAMFSPVTRVEINVSKTRVGQDIDYDKLVLGVRTNGTVSPQDVIHYGASVLRSQFEHFLAANEIPFNEISTQEAAEASSSDVASEGSASKSNLLVDLFLKPIEDLEFSVRAHNCLAGAGIKRVIDLVNLTEEESLKIKNFGRKSLREVKEILAAFNLRFGMNIKELDLKKAIKEQEGKES
jgi:DNA-directed RNA polymerase subunit alpha